MTVQPKALTELAQQISAKQKELHDHLNAHKTDEGYKMNEEQRKAAEDLNRELNDLGAKYDAEKSVYTIAAENEKRAEWLKTPVNALPHQTDEKGAAYRDIGGKNPRLVKTLGELFTESKEFKGFLERIHEPDVKMSMEIESPEMKTLLTTVGWVPQEPVPTMVVGAPRRRLVVTDLMPNVTINNPYVTWFEQTTDTNNAATTAEGAAKNESAVAWTKRSTQVVKITDSIPATTEVLEDIPQARSAINDTLVYHIRYAEEEESLNGDGTAGAHLLGLTQLPDILTQARGSDNNVDAIFKLFTQIRYTGTGTIYAEPSGVVLHPTNWQTIRLMKTTDGAYIWGPPSESGEERVWGKSVVVTPAITVNTALTGDFAGHAKFYRYKQIRISVGWINTQFIENEMTILAEERVAQAVDKQTAFGLATGLN